MIARWMFGIAVLSCAPEPGSTALVQPNADTASEPTKAAPEDTAPKTKPTKPEPRGTGLTFEQALKTLIVQWDPIEGAASYELYEIATPGAARTLVASVGKDVLEVRNPVALHRVWQAVYELDACDGIGNCSLGAVGTVPVGLVDAIGYAKPNGKPNSARYGSDVDISADGTTIAVGAPDDDMLLDGAGAVYIYTLQGDTLTEEVVLTSPSPGKGGDFGRSVALSDDGNVLAVGAPTESRDGAVHVFRRNLGTWTYERGLQGDWIWPRPPWGKTWWREFGGQVAMSGDGNTIAATAHREGSRNDFEELNAGTLYVFEHAKAGWEEVFSLAGPGRATSWSRGLGLNKEGTTLAMLAGSDGLHVFERGALGDWSETFQNKDTVFALEHGVAIDADGNTIVTGKHSQSTATIYVRAGDKWLVDDTLTRSTEYFGFAVDISADGSLVAVGSYDPFDFRGVGSGLKLPATATRAGSVEVFELGAKGWEPVAYLKASNAEENDFFGSSVALSEDGFTVVVGANGEKSTAEGVGGDQTLNSRFERGALYVY